MYKHEFFIQSSERTGEIYRGLLQLAKSSSYGRMAVAVAYATKVGCKLITEALKDEIPEWKKIRKEWLISIDLGITEPDALEFLANLPNSQVRIANAENVLTARLRPRTRFHNKFYLFESYEKQGAIGIFSGSANLTVSGLYLNNEQATSSVWIPPISNSDKLHFNNLMRQKETIDNILSSGMLLNEGLLERYRTLWRPRRLSEDRIKFVERIVEPAPELPLSKAVAMAAAAAFWIEVRYVVENRGSGVPGNQIDLQRGSRVFFGLGSGEVPRNTYLGTVQIRFGGEVIDCHMRFGNNHMDKLNLPIPNAPGPVTYENQVLIFTRNADGTFDLSVGSPKDIAEWRRRSTERNTLYRMRGGREYGILT